jgi:hypothetical protein
MRNPMWSAIVLILGYVSVGVVLGVVCNRLKPVRVVVLLCLIISTTALVSAWPGSWRSWSELVEFLIQGFYQAIFLHAALLLIPFALGAVAARIMPGAIGKFGQWGRGK